jgi:plastocyanin
MKRQNLFFSAPAALAIAFALLATGCNRNAHLGPVANTNAMTTIREAFTAGKTEAGGEKTAASTGTGWATIRGQFIYDGDPPAMAPYKVTKEHEICSLNGKAPPQETLVVNPASKGIKNVAVCLREASRVHDSAKSKDDSFVFDQQHCVFLTHVFGVTIGQTVNIKNSDPTGHNTKIGGANTFNQTIASGQAIPFKPQKEEAMPTQVACSIHEWMTAYMLPRKNGYYAVTDADGKFEIANVPAGEPLEFQVWHESGAAPGGGLIGTSPDAQDVKWSNRGRVTVTLQPDQVKEIKVIVPPKAFRG